MSYICKVKTNSVMRRNLILLTFIVLCSITLKAQETLKERVTRHVYTLADDSMRGRERGTIYAQKALNYIKEELQTAGLNPIEQTTTKEILNRMQMSTEEKRCCGGIYIIYNNGSHNLYCVIEGNDSILKKEYILVHAIYSHFRLSKDEITNGANHNASSVAAMIEFAKMLKENQSLLKRSIVLFFEEDDTSSFEYFINLLPLRAKISFLLDDIGYIDKKAIRKSYVGNIRYYVDKRISKCKKILKSVLKNDNSVPIYIDYTPSYIDYQNKSIPYVNIEGNEIYPKNDIPKALDYDLLTNVTKQIYKVLLTFSSTNKI